LRLVLDAFRHRRDTQYLREPQDRLNETRAFDVDGDRVGERLVDLEDVDGEAAQVAQRRIARAEVVDRDVYAETLRAFSWRTARSVSSMSTLSVISRVS